jgi:hypothetical protein
VSFDGRLRRLEERGRGGICPECGFTPDARRPFAVIYEEHPEKSFDGDPDERCPRCGRELYVVINVVYEGEEGEGALLE